MTDSPWLAVAREAIDQWDLDVENIEEVSHSENVVFRMQGRSGGVFVLRMHRPGYHSYEELVSEQTWTAADSADFQARTQPQSPKDGTLSW